MTTAVTTAVTTKSDRTLDLTGDGVSGLDARDDAAGLSPCLYLMFAGHAPLMGGLRIPLAGLGAVVLGRGRETDWAVQEGRARVDVADSSMSRDHAELVAAEGRFAVRDAGSRNGTRVNGAAVGRVATALSDGDVIEAGRTFFLYRAAVPAWDGGEAIGPAAPALASLDPALGGAFERLARIAASELAVLLVGESGTGKELAARAAHDLSGRRGPFVAVNCAAIPANLFETEMFGCRRGAFSGADEDRPGLIRKADRGTLLLDEVGELPTAAQAALLRVLQEREVLPVGDTRPVAVDFRLICATNSDLPRRVTAGSFRADLLARLSGFVLELPALRRRREDLGLLIAAILRRRAAAAGGVTFHLGAARALVGGAWPANIRELDAAVAAALVLSGGGEIRAEHLPAPPPSSPPAALPDAASPAPPSGRRPLKQVDLARRKELIALLQEHQGNIAAVARALGKGRTQIQRWIKRYGITV